MDSTFAANAAPYSGYIGTILVLPDNKLVLAGDLFSYNVPMLQLNADGSRDTAFDMVPDNTLASLGAYEAYIALPCYSRTERLSRE